MSVNDNHRQTEKMFKKVISKFKGLIFMGLLLSGCCSYPQCVDVLYIQTNENEIKTSAYWYQGRMVESPFPNLYKGLVIETKSLGKVGKDFDKSKLCKESPDLKWYFYQVAIDDPKDGTWYLSGEGWKDMILIWPNKLGKFVNEL